MFSAENARPYRECEWATHSTSGRASCTALQISFFSKSPHKVFAGLTSYVDHNRRSVDQPIPSSLDHVALVVDPHEIASTDGRKALSESVQPKRVRFNGIATRNMSCHAFPKPFGAKDAESCSKSAFEVLALLVWILEAWRLWEAGSELADVRHLHLRRLLGCRAGTGRVARGHVHWLRMSVLVKSHDYR